MWRIGIRLQHVQRSQALRPYTIGPSTMKELQHGDDHVLCTACNMAYRGRISMCCKPTQTCLHRSRAGKAASPGSRRRAVHARSPGAEAAQAGSVAVQAPPAEAAGIAGRKGLEVVGAATVGNTKPACQLWALAHR